MFESFWFIITYPVLLVASVVTGYVLAHNRYFKKQRIWKPSGIENSIIGFYGLLLSFALLLVGNANRDRTSLVHLHADALGAIYRESTLANDSAAVIIREHVTEILSSKLQVKNKPEQKIMNRGTSSVYDHFIADVKKMRDTHSITPEETRFYMDKIHTAVSLDYRIQYSQQERAPVTIMILLILGSLLIGLLIGFTNGFNEEHHFLVPVIFIVITSLTVITILDLDNPTVGLIRPSYKNYEDMLRENTALDLGLGHNQ